MVLITDDLAFESRFETSLRAGGDPKQLKRENPLWPCRAGFLLVRRVGSPSTTGNEPGDLSTRLRPWSYSESAKRRMSWQSRSPVVRQASTTDTVPLRIFTNLDPNTVVLASILGEERARMCRSGLFRGTSIRPYGASGSPKASWTRTSARCSVRGHPASHGRRISSAARG